jgi:hypothetical protein
MLSLRVKQRSKLWEMLKEQGKMYISSTELAAVFHASAYGSRRKLYLQKTSNVTRKYSNPAQQHGTTYEPLAIYNACHWLNYTLGKTHDWMQPGILRDPWSVVTCSPDQICSDFGLEVKCPWKRKLPETKFEIINDNLLQCFACIHVTKLPHWYLWYYNAYNQQSVCYRINSNQALWEGVIAPAAAKYLQSLDSPEAIRVKRRSDGLAWEAIRGQLLQGVERVL